MPFALSDVAGCVLAGGLGRRLGGVDKGLVELAGRPLAARALERLRPQVATLVVSANRNVEAYARLCDRVVSDATSAFDGPLAGVVAAMAATDAPVLAVVPCDCPFFPEDLVARLGAAFGRPGVEIATVRAAGRLQPAFLLARTALRPAIETALASGERRIARFFAQRETVEVDFSDAPAAFDNINTPEDLAAAERRLEAA